MMDTPTAQSAKIAGIRRNVFDGAHWAIADWSAFRWHTHGGEATADQPNSSQAFCISTWATAAGTGGAAVRAAIADQLADGALAAALRSYTAAAGFALEHVLEGDVLGEHGGNPTNVDVLWELGGVVVAVESKLTEEFSPCRQARDGHCNGRLGAGSDLKTKSDVRCRLERAEPRRSARRYLQVLEDLGAAPLAEVGHSCPLSGGGYQVARVIASAAELGRRSGRDWRAVFAYPSRLGRHTREHIGAITKLLSPEHQARVLTLDYSGLAPALAIHHDAVAAGLGHHLSERLAACARGGAEP